MSSAANGGFPTSSQTPPSNGLVVSHSSARPCDPSFLRSRAVGSRLSKADAVLMMALSNSSA
jgi:hypothetical protein